MFTSRTFSQQNLFYVYNDTTSRNCSSIINVNREKYQIIKSQCWQFLVTNCETRNDGKFHRAGQTRNFFAPCEKNESGTHCWLTGPVKSAAVLSNEGKPENVL